jgi:hypothetical protein
VRYAAKFTGSKAGYLRKQPETTVHAHFKERNGRRDDPENDQCQHDQGQIMRPIRFVMMNQSHDFLPTGSLTRLMKE